MNPHVFSSYANAVLVFLDFITLTYSLKAYEVGAGFGLLLFSSKIPAVKVTFSSFKNFPLLGKLFDQSLSILYFAAGYYLCILA